MGRAKSLALLVAGAALVLPALTAAPAAQAAPSQSHGKKPPVTGTISLIVLNQAAPAAGDVVDFTVATTATDKPWVDLACSQNGVLVYHWQRAYYEGAYGYGFTLASEAWTSGPARCEAKLLKLLDLSGTKSKVLATTQFDVTG